jgi:iron(III) transport system permease protein
VMRAWLGWLLVPLLAVLIVVPVGFMFLGAFMSGALVDPEAHLTLEKVAAVYTTLPYLRTLASTLVIALLVAALASGAGVGLAWLISRTDIPSKATMETCVIAPLFLSPFVGAIAWLILGSPKAGIVNVVAASWVGTTGPVINVATPAGIVLIMALYYVPYAYLTVSAALRNMDPAMEEAAYLNGSGILGTALRVTLPVVRPSLISAFFFIFVLACGTFAIPAALDRASQVRFLAVDVFQASATYPIDYGTSAAIGTLLFWISMTGIAAYRFASRAARRFVTVTARGYRIRLVRLRGWRAPAIGMVLLYVLLSIVLPYIALLFAAFARPGGNIFAPAWTAANARAVAGSAEVAGAIVNTLEVGLITPTVCVALGLLIAYAIRRIKVRGAQLLDYITMFSIAVPGIVFGTGVFWTYVLTPVYGTIWVLVLAFLAAYLPFAYRISDTALLQIDRSLEEASSLCGAGHLRTATSITLRLAKPALLSAWIMVFIFSVREISAAVLLTSSDNVVLSVLSYNYLDYGDVPKAAVVGLLQTSLLIAGVLAGRFVFRVKLSRQV